MEGIIQSKSKTFLAFCFSFLLGITIASFVNRTVDFVYLYFFLFVLVGGFFIYKNNKKVLFVVTCLLFSLCGFARYTFALPQDVAVSRSKQVLTGHVATEPDIRQDSIRYIVQAEQGRVLIKSDLYPRYDYGDELRVSCRLEKPEPIEDFRYDMYLATFDVFLLCRDAKIEKINSEKGNVLLGSIFSLKTVIAKKVNLLWHEPYAGFMAGLLYGYRGGLGSLNEQFARTGVTHIIAISGYNITIIASILMTLCIHLWIPRKRAFWLISLGIFLFVIFAGASGSVVRAGIMGFLVLLAKQLGRLNRVGNAMALTAVLMTLHNPFVLIWDAGFQLSFLATLGLVYFNPVLEKYVSHMPEFLGIKESLISTMSAIVVTLPLILYQFGRLSIVAPIVNVLILWLIPWIMLGGFVAVIVSFLFAPLGQIIAWLSWLGMKYITVIVDWFSNLPFASVDLRISWWIMVASYVFLVYTVRIFIYR